jgi:hypothetical protein
MEVGQVLSENYPNLFLWLFSLPLLPFCAVSLIANPVFSSRRKQAYTSLNQLFILIVWGRPSPDSARDF